MDEKSIWTVENIRAIIRDLVIAAAFLIGVWNGNKIDKVETKQDHQVAKAEEVKETLDETTKEQKATLSQQRKSIDKIEKTTKAVADAQESQLWLVWKRLEDTSFETNTKEDIDAAAKAKKAYFEYLKRPKE